MLHGRHWCFKQKLLVFQEIDKDVQPSKVILNFSPFWICLYNLPFSSRYDEHVRSIASILGHAMEIEEDFLEINFFS